MRPWSALAAATAVVGCALAPTAVTDHVKVTFVNIAV
jgi:hypothetical protein